MRKLGASLREREAAAGVAPSLEDGVALIILEAPFGYGKTALIERWRKTMPATIPVLEVDVGDESWLAGLEEWARGLESPALAIIDDYHLATSTTTDRLLVSALQTNPNSHVLVSGRSTMLLDTPPVTARVQTKVLRAEDLALSEEEVAKRLEVGGFVKGGRDWALIQAADGWPVVIDEIVRRRLEGEEEGSWLRSRAQEILARDETQQVARLLMATQGTSAFVVTKASGLSQEAVGEALSVLVESGLVRMKRRAGIPNYAPHDLLSAVLKEEDPSGKNQETLDLAVALEAEENARVDPAGSLKKVLDRGLLRAAQNITQMHFLQLSGDPEAWELVREVTLADQLQAPALGGLRLSVAYATQKADRATLRKWAKELKTVAMMLEENAGPGAIEGAVLGLAAERELGDWASAVERAATLEEELLKRPIRSAEGRRTLVPLMYEAITFTGLLGGDLDLAERAALHGLTISKTENSPTAVDAARALALICAIRADTAAATEYLEEARAEKRKFGLKQTKNSEATASVAWASVLLSEGRLDEAARELEMRGLDVARIDAWEQYAAVEAWLNRYSKGNRAALTTLRRRIQEAGVDRMSSQSASRLTGEVANLLIYEGELVSAEKLLDLPLEPTPALSLAKARLALAAGKPREALMSAEQARGGGDRGEDSVAALLAAVALDLDGDRSGALEELKRLDLGLPTAKLRLVLSVAPYESLLEIAKAHSKEGGPRFRQLVEELPEAYRFKGSSLLSEAELRTLAALTERGTAKEAGDHLGLSVNTVKSHLRSIYKKLGVSTRDEMVRAAKARGL